MLSGSRAERRGHHVFPDVGVDQDEVEGAFRHDLGRFGPGDFDEADETMEHNPVVEDEVPCICLVALKGSIALQGWMGRLLQPLIRF